MKLQSATDRQSKDNMEWELHKGHGPRSHTVTVTFPEEFAVPPTVVVSLVGFDVHAGHNARLEVKASHAEHNQFRLTYRTWGDTYVHQAEASWIAYGK